MVEREHRVFIWREHEHGGSMPALEKLEVVLESLRGFATLICD